MFVHALGLGLGLVDPRAEGSQRITRESCWKTSLPPSSRCASSSPDPHNSHRSCLRGFALADGRREGVCWTNYRARLVRCAAEGVFLGGLSVPGQSVSQSASQQEEQEEQRGQYRPDRHDQVCNGLVFAFSLRHRVGRGSTELSIQGLVPLFLSFFLLKSRRHFFWCFFFLLIMTHWAPFWFVWTAASAFISQWNESCN